MRYFEVTDHELQDARPGLLLAEQLLKDDHFIPYLYGLTTKEDLVLSAQEALHDGHDEDEEGNPLAHPTLTEIAVAIPFSSDTLYYLSGSGLILRTEDFAYNSPNEGPRTESLRWAHTHVKVRMSDFTQLALSSSDSDLDEFLKQYGTKGTAEQPEGTVTRTDTSAVTASQRKPLPNPIDQFLAD